MKKTITFIVLFAFSLLAKAQDIQSINKIKSALDSLNIKQLQEKMYVATDKETYLTGEKIWYKAFCVDASFHLPSALSKVAYVELVNKDGNPSIRQIVELENGKGDNAIEVPIQLPSGNYTLRAYTKWMRNSDPDFFFTKTLQIINPEAANYVNDSPLETKQELASLAFFPEGGDLVEGLTSTVAFKAVLGSGKPSDVSGMVIANGLDTVANFSSENGYGTFGFTPKAGNSYVVYAKSKNSEEFEFSFPKPLDKGLVLSVKKDGTDKWKLALQANAAYENKPYYLIIQNKHQLVYNKSLFVGENLNLSITEKELAEGINQLTVFDASLKPVAERLLFKQPSTMALELEANKASFSTRKKVDITLSAKSAEGTPLSGEFALSVAKRVGNNFSNDDITSYLHLSSDLKGDAGAAAKLLKDGASESEMMDMVMMTHGWRRFAWEDVLDGEIEKNAHVPEYNGWVMSGKITERETGEPAKNRMVFLAFAGKEAMVQLQRTQEDGKFYFVVNGVYNEKDLVIQLMNDTTNQTKIEIDDFYDTRKIDAIKTPYALPSSEIKKLNTIFLNEQIEDAYFFNKEHDKETQYLNHHFYDEAHSVYDMSRYHLLPIMDEILREIAKGVYRKKTEGGLKFTIFDYDKNDFIDKLPLVLIDGVPAFRFTDVQDFNTKELGKLEVYRKSFFLNKYAFGGLLHVVSKKGDLGELELPESAKRVYINALEPQREFYSPSYNESNLDSRIPDFRNTLYWNPSVQTDEQGNATISFFTSDDTGNYSISVEGLSEEGVAGTASYEIEVKSRVE
ncbi:hypothetical protein R9C00_03875 [Flammeovirgaceae bacterium SG7u.111]|nr:hypothetical protein [Flammeovirgaceae bacterium SG7u.132]WPO36584.1 hypothetical protein R9C00_03875 [Flammeovirgaceae bacterium SG7u.111]